MTHDELVKAGRKWLVRGSYVAFGGQAEKCPVVVTELASQNREIPDVLGWTGVSSILLECKASRSDFKADAGKSFRKLPETGMGHYRLYLTPPGLVKKEELPAGWGLAEVHGKSVRVMVYPQRMEANVGAENRLILSLLRRLDIRAENSISIKSYVWGSKNTASVSIAQEKIVKPDEPAWGEVDGATGELLLR